MESSRVEKRLDDEGWGESKGKTGRPEEKALASYFRISSLVPRWNFMERAEGQDYKKPLQCRLSNPNASETELQSSKVKGRAHEQNLKLIQETPVLSQ